MTTGTFPRRLFSPVTDARVRRSLLTGFGATLLVGLLVVIGASAAIGVSAASAVLPGVSVGGVDVGGLDRDAAAEHLTEALPSLSTGKAVISVAEVEHVRSYADLGRGYELDAMVDAAFAVGRTGDPLADGITRLRNLAKPVALPVDVRAYEPSALASLGAEVAAEINRQPVEAMVTRDGTDFVVGASEAGRQIDAGSIKQAVAAALDSTDPADVHIELEAVPIESRVDTAMAEAAAEAARGMVGDLELTIPEAADDEALSLLAETIAEWISFGPEGELAYTARLDEDAAGAAIGALAEQVDQDPISARITVADGGGLGGVVPGQTGRSLDAEASTDALLEMLAQRARGSPVTSLALAVDVTEPSTTTAAAEEMLPRMELVSSWNTNYVPGDGNGFGANISIGAWDLDGYNISPGEWFSFWGGIGPVTAERGYTYGGAIINGRSVAQGALAGGICSTSTTLFNAAMRFGLEIGERDNHYYYIDRYPTGLDATVAIVDNSVKDLTFRNDTEHPIVIRGFGSPGQVTFQLWSVPSGRTVALSAPVISNQRAAIETTQVSSELAPGTSRRVEYPHDGFDVSITRTVTAADGTVLHNNTWFSDYRPVNGITLVGPTAAAPSGDTAAGDEGGTAAVGDGAP